NRWRSELEFAVSLLWWDYASTESRWGPPVPGKLSLRRSPPPQRRSFPAHIGVPTAARKSSRNASDVIRLLSDCGAEGDFVVLPDFLKRRPRFCTAKTL